MRSPCTASQAQHAPPTDRSLPHQPSAIPSTTRLPSFPPFPAQQQHLPGLRCHPCRSPHLHVPSSSKHRAMYLIVVPLPALRCLGLCRGSPPRLAQIGPSAMPQHVTLLAHLPCKVTRSMREHPHDRTMTRTAVAVTATVSVFTHRVPRILASMRPAPRIRVRIHALKMQAQVVCVRVHGCAAAV